MQAQELTPLWDEAIAGLLIEAQAALDAPLTTEKLQELAVEHATRLGDIIETLYLMAIYGDWTYTDEDGLDKDLDEVALEELYATGRIDKSNSDAFSGVWAPAG